MLFLSCHFKNEIMQKIAIFPGSFDPFTIGHESVVRRATQLFDRIVIMIGYNANKAPFFPLEKRVKWIKQVFNDDPTISVETYEGLTVDFCKKVGAHYILRGLRTAADFEFERAIAQVNKQMYPDIETVFLLTIPEHTPVNSTIVRDIIMHGGDASRFLPRSLNMDDFKTK
jgi:pantetheine-phosphate adenylyltransferase